MCRCLGPCRHGSTRPRRRGRTAKRKCSSSPALLPTCSRWPQIRFACVQAQEGIFRLKGQAFPASVNALLDEGRNAAEQPGSIRESRLRITETIDMVNAAAAKMAEIEPSTPIAHVLPQGMIFDLTAEQYVRDWTLPQFYFHVVTAYAILRAQGIELGDVDYVAHMFPYLRPGTAPSR